MHLPSAATGPFSAIVLAACLAGCGGGKVNPEDLTKAVKVSTTQGKLKTAGDFTFRFTDVTGECGVDFVYKNGEEADHFSILESLGGGAGMIDFDGDGLLDLCFPGGGKYEEKTILGLPTALYRNLGDWRFTNVSQAAGDGFPAEKYSHGVFGGDYNSDGFVDFLITGYGGLQLWRNLGDGTFDEVHSAARLADDSWSTAAGFGDVNGDGLIDLYVAHYVNWSFENDPFCTGPKPDLRDICSPKIFDPLPDSLYINSGDGEFRDATAEAKLRPDGKGLGVALADIDNDGDLDIYVANDTTENFLYVNNGRGAFDEIGAIAGVAVDDRGTPNGSMGIDIGDFNRDGLADIWVANFEVESFALYRNEGGRQFLHVSQAAGVTALNGLFVGFGTVFVDLNRDGYEDLVVANGHVIKYPRMAPLLQTPIVLMNEGGRYFRRRAMDDDPYFAAQHAGRGLAAGDLDNDGDQDLVFSNNQERAAILRNDCVDRSQSLQIRLIGTVSNRDAIGATIAVECQDGPQRRYIKGGASYLSHLDQRALFGIAEGDAPRSIEITWPRGGAAQKVGPPMNGELVVVEPALIK